MNYTEWTFNEKSPIYIQLAHKLRYSILSGRLTPGENILSINSMAAILHPNVNTVAKSYSLINQEGLIFANRNKKYIVTLDSVLVNQKRIQEVQLLCHNYIRAVRELGFSKTEILSFIQEYSRS